MRCPASRSVKLTVTPRKFPVTGSVRIGERGPARFWELLPSLRLLTPLPREHEVFGEFDVGHALLRCRERPPPEAANATATVSPVSTSGAFHAAFPDRRSDTTRPSKSEILSGNVLPTRARCVMTYDRRPFPELVDQGMIA